MRTTTSPAETPAGHYDRRSDKGRVENDWRARGFSCELWIDPPDQVRRDFEHDADELVLLVDGTAQIEIAGKVVKLEPGDEMTIPAGARHTIRNCGAGPARWLQGFPLTNQGSAEAAQ